MMKNILNTATCLSAVLLLQTATCLSAVLLLLGGCNEKYEMKFPLAVSQHTLDLPETAGSSHVLVYSTGAWTVGFDRSIDWASLDRREGYGNSEFVLSFDANYGISRKATIEIVSGSLRDSIVISQTGTLSSVTLKFDESSFTVTDLASTVSVGLTTNLYYAGNDFSSRVVFYDDDGNEGGVEPWLSNVVVSSEAATFDIERNIFNKYRTADLTVYVEDADGKEYSTTASIIQVPAGMGN